MRITSAIKTFFCVIVFLAISGCTNHIDTEKERQLLLQTDREFSQYSVNNSAPEAFKAYLLENALQLPAGENPIQGRDKIYEEMLKSGNNYTLSWEPQEGEVSLSGDMGYTWGIYTVDIQSEEGEITSRKGKYLNVWKKNKAGDWRVLIDTGNQNPAEEQ